MDGADRARVLATMFAGKEAVVKALNLADRTFSWRDIEVLPHQGGKAVVNLRGSLGGANAGSAGPVICLALACAGDLVLALAVVQS